MHQLAPDLRGWINANAVESMLNHVGHIVYPALRHLLRGITEVNEEWVHAQNFLHEEGLSGTVFSPANSYNRVITGMIMSATKSNDFIQLFFALVPVYMG
jgi:hypothetical protein